MIVNPYAEQQSLADQIRNYQQIDFTTAMTVADAAIISMIAGTELEPQAAPPSWRHRLRHWIMNTFIVNTAIAEATVALIVAGGGGGEVVLEGTSEYLGARTNSWPDIAPPADIAEGDLLVLYAGCIEKLPILTDAVADGWTELGNAFFDSDSYGIVVHHKIATAADVADGKVSYTVVLSATALNLVYYRFSGHDPAAPIPVSHFQTKNNISTSDTIQSIDTTVNNAYPIMGFGVGSGTNTPHGYTTNDWLKQSELVNTIGGSDSSVQSWATKSVPSAGATGDCLATWPVTRDMSAFVCAISPA